MTDLHRLIILLIIHSIILNIKHAVGGYIMENMPETTNTPGPVKKARGRPKKAKVVEVHDGNIQEERQDTNA